MADPYTTDMPSWSDINTHTHIRLLNLKELKEQHNIHNPLA